MTALYLLMPLGGKYAATFATWTEGLAVVMEQRGYQRVTPDDYAQAVAENRAAGFYDLKDAQIRLLLDAALAQHKHDWIRR